MAGCAEEEEAEGEDGDLAGPPPPGPGDALEEEEDGDLLGPTPPPAKKRKVQLAAGIKMRSDNALNLSSGSLYSRSTVQTAAEHSPD